MSAHIDFETYSAADIRKVGSYRYARDESTEVLICSYLLPDMHQPAVWLPQEEDCPDDLLEAVNSDMLFWAHNAMFERGIWHYVLHERMGLPDIAVERWRCTALLAAGNGLGRQLDVALRQLGGDVQKDPEGQRLIKIFSVPRKPTKADPSTRIYPKDNPLAFKRFIKYCQQDVRGEKKLHEALPPLHAWQWDFYTLDLKMNERGLPIDLPLVKKARAVLTELEQDIAQRVADITGGIKATQTAKLTAWLSEHGVQLDNLQAKTIKDVLADVEGLPARLRDLLALRVEAGKASTKKLIAMEVCAHPLHSVIQGSFLIHGAHTGRYAGRLIQPQNFIRGTLKDHAQKTVFDLLDKYPAAVFKMLYEWPIDTISQCMRGFIKAPDRYRFVVVDYTAIEARVLAWVAGEERVLAAYRKGVDVYKMMASSLFNIRIEDVSSEQRRLAKNLVLGCGYSLGGPKFVDYCANLGVTIDPEFAKIAVKKYRDDHPKIVESWKIVEDCWLRALAGERVKALHCTFYKKREWLCIRLPSGREIRYHRPRAIPVERWGRNAHDLSYATDYHGKIGREKTYGGKLIENIVQGIAFDVMAAGMTAAEEAGYPVLGTVHDELITLKKIGQGSAKELEHVVCDLGGWTDGIPLNAEGFECDRYRKG
jgi:DNA polymerase